MAQALTPQQLGQYLQRTKYDDCLEPNLRTLARLQTSHQRTIPFGNLSMRLEEARGHGVSADVQQSFDKLVLAGREGWCYEQNGLFAAALRAVGGFDVYEGAARVVLSGGEHPPAAAPPADAPPLVLTSISHRMAFVHLEGRTFLVDVGFGADTIPLPLRLPPGPPYSLPEGEPGDAPYAEHGGPAAWEGLPVRRASQYRLRLGLAGCRDTPDPASAPHFQHRAGWYLQKRYTHQQSGAAGWRDLYFFRLDQYLPADYRQLNAGLLADKDSFFAHNLVMSLHRPDGRATMQNDTMRLWRDAGDGAGSTLEAEVAVRDSTHRLQLLREHFGVSLPARLVA